jgi:hypothetical protein
MPREQTLPRDFLRSRIAIKDGETLRATPSDGTLKSLLEPWTPGTTSLEAAMQPGDELWIWSTAEWTWESLMGRGGYAIVRNGEPVDFIMTEMN